ncbi:MAG: hypothetical protein ACP5UB_09625, partial [Candidatus Sumerlaeaceae bacterium]
MQTMKLTLTVAAIASVAALATAQPWPNNYAMGEAPVFNPAWTSNAPAYLMTNLGGNVYGIDITAPGVGSGPYNRFQWKVTDGTWSNSAPSNTDGNAYGRATTTGTVVSLRCDFNAQNDGFIP